MDISTLISDSYESFEPNTPISKLVGTFADPAQRGVLVVDDDFEGVVTRRQLGASHHQPNQTLGSIATNVPRLRPDEDVRRVAKLMIDSDSFILPVFEGETLQGVVTADAIIDAVRDSLDVIAVKAIWSEELVSLSPTDTFGKTIPRFREHNIAHLPVVEDGQAVGIVSLYDLVDMRIRSMSKSQGGSPGGSDSTGGQIASEAASSRRGGYGAREGELNRMLDLPVSDVMVSPVATVDVSTSLDEAVEMMQEVGGSSLVVTRDDSPSGIVTITDILRALTIEAPDTRAVQIYGIDLLEDTNYDKIVEMIDNLDARNAELNILDAKIHLHEHDETQRGKPLVLARIRLHTDEGLFIATGEGFGSSHAIREARDVIERRMIDHKEYAQTKKPMDDTERWEKRFGWWLEG